MYSWEVKLDNLEESKARADRFERWYEDDGLKDGVESIRQAYINAWLNTNYKDVDAREKCYLAVAIVDRVESHIRNVIGGGKVAEKTLADIEKENNSGKVRNLFK